MRVEQAKWQTFSLMAMEGWILMLFFVWVFGLRFEKFFNNIFYCMPHAAESETRRAHACNFNHYLISPNLI